VPSFGWPRKITIRRGSHTTWFDNGQYRSFEVLLGRKRLPVGRLQLSAQIEPLCKKPRKQANQGSDLLPIPDGKLRGETYGSRIRKNCCALLAQHRANPMDPLDAAAQGGASFTSTTWQNSTAE